MTTEGIDVRSVGNSLILHETALVEAFNLKAAIEYQLKNCKYSEAQYWLLDYEESVYSIFCVCSLYHGAQPFCRFHKLVNHNFKHQRI